MSSSAIKTTLIIILLATAAYALFSKNNSIKKARVQVNALTLQVDSLRAISQTYSELEQKYDSLYGQLEGTREGLDKIREKLEVLKKTQAGSLTSIRGELLTLIDQYDTIKALPSVSKDDLDSLKF
jgi:predicted  nucleic acid-binding Zn-ribbon protein